MYGEICERDKTSSAPPPLKHTDTNKKAERKQPIRTKKHTMALSLQARRGEVHCGAHLGEGSGSVQAVSDRITLSISGHQLVYQGTWSRSRIKPDRWCSLEI